MNNKTNREKTIQVVLIALILFIVASGVFFISQSGLFSKDPEVSIQANNSYDETLRVVMGEYYPPFSFVKDGEYTGHDVELANELANRLGMNLETEYLTWSECIEAVQSGRADMIMSVDYEYPEDGIEYTIPVADNPWMAFSKGDVLSYAGLYGKRIGIGVDTDALGDSSFAENYVAFDSYEPAFDALERDEIDVVITKYPVGTYIADKKGYKDISATCELAGGHFAIGISANRGELLEKLNGVILDMSNDGTLKKLSNKWFGSFVKAYSLGDILGKHPEYFIVVAAVVIFLLAMTALLAIRESVSEKKLAQREAEEAEHLIDSVTSDYHIVYQVNMDDDSFRVLRMESPFMDKAQIISFKTFSEIMKGFFDVIHPDEKNRMAKEIEYDTIRENLENTKSYSVEYRVLIDGITSWHEMNITKVDDNSFVIGFVEKDVEITKRRLEEKRYGECFALFVVDIDTGMLKVIKNEGEYQVCKVGESTPYTQFMQGMAQSLSDEPKEFFDKISNLDYAKRDFASDDKRTYAYKSIQFAGDRWIDVTSYCLLRHDDGTPAMFTLGFSIVDALGMARQELQDRIASQSKELETALSMAQSANKAKTEFLFNMSHDIRTPMNAITGFTNMAIKNIDNKEKVLDCLDKTQKSGTMLLSLVNSVLEVSRIESGHAVLEEQPGNVYYSFANIENTMREMAKMKDISLSFEFGDIWDQYVYADFSRCMRVFVNVISNAIKYTPEGGKVKVSCEQFKEAEEGYAKYRYIVTDNGIGMSEEFQKHIFDQFTRENTSTVSGIQGSGLGMTVVKSFVDLLGGTVSVQSKRGEGTTIEIILPFKLQESESYVDPVSGEVIASNTRTMNAEYVDFTGKKVLLVEDNELNREIAIEILEEEGLYVEDADDGTVAVDMVKEKGPDYYDFILMDIQMPIMNGYDATKEIRAMYPDAHIPIIALSANAFAEDKAASLAAGLDDHVAKPINVKELFSALAKFL